MHIFTHFVCLYKLFSRSSYHRDIFQVMTNNPQQTLLIGRQVWRHLISCSSKITYRYTSLRKNTQTPTELLFYCLNKSLVLFSQECETRWLPKQTRHFRTPKHHHAPIGLFVTFASNNDVDRDTIDKIEYQSMRLC